MQDLTAVGLSKDGRKLLLISASGEEFAVPVDTRLRAALRGENARLGQLEMKMESALRPRDIQARIRAGESPEEVATAAQTTVDAIMGFATPVLAERAHVAQSAQKSSVRRRSSESSSGARTLGEAAGLYFADHHLHDEDVAWDAWRRADGRWALVAEYAVGGRPRKAEFTHDLRGRYVVADNDEAKLLTGELKAPQPRAPREGAAGRRLSSVPASQDELPLGDDALELVREREEAAAPAEDTTPAAEAAPAPEQAPAAPESPFADTADADWMIDGAAPVDEPHAPPAPEPTPEPVAEEPTAEEPVAEQPVEEPVAEEPVAQPEPEPESEPAPAPRKKKARSSVPSWDEIMFGGGKSD